MLIGCMELLVPGYLKLDCLSCGVTWVLRGPFDDAKDPAGRFIFRGRRRTANADLLCNDGWYSIIH